MGIESAFAGVHVAANAMSASAANDGAAALRAGIDDFIFVSSGAA